MTSHHGIAARFGGLLSAFAPRFVPKFMPRLTGLRAAAFAFVLLGLPLSASEVRAQPAAPSAHVYLVRGVLNIFSLGMDEIAAKLQRQGITATVHNHLAWASIADDAAAEYKSGRAKTIILVGHSSGATCLPDIVERLDHHGVPVKLAIGLDSVFHTSLSGRVGRYINFYVANGAGTRVERTANFHGALDNVDVEAVPGVGHLTIDKNELMQRKIIAAIDAAVLSGPREAPTATPSPTTRPRPVTGSGPQPVSSAKRAAVN